MINNETGTRLHRHLAAMAALERSIEQRIDRVLAEGLDDAGVVALLEDLRHSADKRREVLTARLKEIAPGVDPPDPVSAILPLEAVYEGNRYRASGVLLGLHAFFSQSVLGYAVLIELSFRAADSVEALGPRNTGDLAWEHMRTAAATIQEVCRMLPYVVVSELEEEGSECRCPCPTCGLGICGCPLAFRRRLDIAFAEAGPIEKWPGLRMVRPRSGSSAAQAGLRKDDLLTAVDGKEIDSIPMLQETIRSHDSGERIQFRVEGNSGERSLVTLVRP